MKIGILTQPLHDNYGGLLQAYALKEVLKDMGHEVIIINRKSKAAPVWRTYASITKSKLIGRKLSPNILIKQTLLDEVSKHTKKFRDKYLTELSTDIVNQNGMKRLNSMGFDAYIVGSDQCWRPKYSPAISNYFLDFAVNDTHVKRISYAASFGVSDWEFSDTYTNICSNLLEKFDAVSVREKSAIGLVEKYLKRNDCIQVVDPTMLLPIEKYESIISNECIGISEGNLKVYILDNNKDKIEIVDFTKNKLNLKPFEVLPTKRLGYEIITKDNAREFAFPNPAKWLRGFKDAKFVITDSFHGTVFSILYNKPFICIGNISRGMARFESLLNMFDLSDRLVSNFSKEGIHYIISKEIDWEGINYKLKQEQKMSLDFLKANLES